MKADFETVGKRMPYVETEEYVSRLVDRCADRAIARSKRPARSIFSRSIGIDCRRINNPCCYRQPCNRPHSRNHCTKQFAERCAVGNEQR